MPTKTKEAVPLRRSGVRPKNKMLWKEPPNVLIVAAVYVFLTARTIEESEVASDVRY